ncbi:BON domain-containing protein [bacterium]|nr:MAG: BON domain-containing protein [bacterium]
MKLTNFALAGLFGAALLGGCTPEARDKYDSAGDSVSNAAKKTGDAVSTDAKKTGEAIENTAEGAVEATKDAAKNAADAVDNSGITLKVKNAILTAENLEAKDLNVDTIGKKVVLRGSVTTAENKKRAEDIAKTQVGGEFTVENQLTVN